MGMKTKTSEETLYYEPVHAKIMTSVSDTVIMACHVK